MRLNLLNQTVVMADAVAVAGLQDLNPRFGEARLINKELFKYSSLLDPSAQVLVNRVDLGELLKAIPQDISELDFAMAPGGDPTAVNDAYGLDPQTSVPLLDSSDPELLPESDTLGLLYVNWCRLIGLTDVPRSLVDLATDQDKLFITFTRSPVFCGTVEVKIKGDFHA